MKKTSILILACILGLFGCRTSPQRTTPLLRPIESHQIQFAGDFLEYTSTNTKPALVFHVPPKYPDELKKSGIEGFAKVAIAINSNGQVFDAQVGESNDERFGFAARQAVLKWKFKPALKNSIAVGCWVIVPIVFAIQN